MGVLELRGTRGVTLILRCQINDCVAFSAPPKEACRGFSVICFRESWNVDPLKNQIFQLSGGFELAPSSFFKKSAFDLWLAENEDRLKRRAKVQSRAEEKKSYEDKVSSETADN